MMCTTCETGVTFPGQGDRPLPPPHVASSHDFCYLIACPRPLAKGPDFAKVSSVSISGASDTLVNPATAHAMYYNPKGG